MNVWSFLFLEDQNNLEANSICKYFHMNLWEKRKVFFFFDMYLHQHVMLNIFFSIIKYSLNIKIYLNFKIL